MAEMFVLFLGGDAERDPAPYLGFASAARQAAVRRFRFASDKNRSLWAELYARRCVGETAKLSPDDVEIAHDEKGKPFCPNIPLSVSLSHSGAYIAAAVGRGAVGVDVERRRRMSLAVSERWFRPEEHDYLLSLPEEERGRAFFRLWTLKEAALKYTGEGLSGGPETVDCFALQNAADDTNAEALAGRSFPLPEGAVVSVVTRHAELPQKARCFVLTHGAEGIFGDAFFEERDAVFPLPSPGGASAFCGKLL